MSRLIKHTSSANKSKNSSGDGLPNNSINPAYVVGGVAAAGLGGAALEQYKDNRKHTPSTLESIATGTLGVMDGTVSRVGTALNIIEMPLAPVAMGGMILSMLGEPIAHGFNKIGIKSPLKAVEWSTDKLQAIQDTTFSELGKKIHPQLGKKVEAFTTKAINTSAPVLNTVSHIPGLGGLHSKNLKTTSKEIGKTSAFHGIWQATWVGGAALQNYMVAREIGDQIYALRQLQADLTGKDINDVSSFAVLTGSVEKPVEIARSQMLKISAAHSFTSLAGLAMAIKSNLINQKLGGVAGKIGFGGGMANMMLMMVAFAAPAKVSEFVETMVGEPILASYVAMREAEKSGHNFNVSEYAGFVFAASERLRNMDRSKAQFLALRLGEQYAAESTKISDILREVHDGRMDARVESIVAEQQAAKNSSANSGISYVEKEEMRRKQAVSPLMRKQEKDAIGPMTARLQQQSPATGRNLTTSA